MSGSDNPELRQASIVAKMLDTHSELRKSLKRRSVNAPDAYHGGVTVDFLAHRILLGVDFMQEMRDSLNKIELCILLLTILVYVTVTGSLIIFICKCCLKRRSNRQFPPGALPLSVASLSKSGSLTSLKGATILGGGMGASVGMGGMGHMQGLTKANCQQYQYPPHLIPRIRIDNPPPGDNYDEDDPRLIIQPMKEDGESTHTQHTDDKETSILHEDEVDETSPETQPIIAQTSTSSQEKPRRSSLEQITLAEDVV